MRSHLYAETSVSTYKHENTQKKVMSKLEIVNLLLQMPTSQHARIKNKPKEYPQQHGAQHASAPENSRDHEPWATLVKLWWTSLEPLVKLLVGPSAEPFGSSTRICPREPQRVRKQFCPETFAMAEDPKASAVGEK